MKKPNAGITLVFLSVILSIGCKKKKVDEIPVNEKVGAYAALGYNYLFSVDKNNNDSIMPVFIAKANAGFYKLIINEFSHGIRNNNGYKQFGENLEKWLPSISNFNELNKYHECLLDENGYMSIDNLYSERNNKNFNPSILVYRNMNPIISQNDTVFFEKPDKDYPWPSSYPKSIYNIKRKNGNSVSIYKNSYKASLFKQGDLTYFLYTRPDNLDVYTFSAFLNFQVEDNNGSILRKDEMQSAFTTTVRGACDNEYVDGLNIYPVTNGTGKPPYFVFYRSMSSDKELHHAFEYFTIFGQENYTTLNRVWIKCENTIQSFKIFAFKSELYISSFNAYSLNNNCYLYKLVGEKFERQEIKLKGIKGIFGNENGIIAAIQNVEKGLDFVQINR